MCLHRERMVEGPQLQPERMSQLCHGIVHCELAACSSQTAIRHNRESHIAHLILKPMLLCPAVVNSTSLSTWCSMVWFPATAWKRNCFVSRRDVRAPIRRATNDSRSRIDQQEQRDHETSALHSHAAWPVQSADASAGLSVVIAKRNPSK